MKQELSIFEKAVLEKLLDGNIPLLGYLRQQLTRCTVVKREFTGVGFYTEFEIPRDIERVVGLNVEFGDVVGEISGLKNGAGFLLYVKNGLLDMLEGYSYNEPWPSIIGSFSLKYHGNGERDWANLEKELACGR